MGGGSDECHRESTMSCGAVVRRAANTQLIKTEIGPREFFVSANRQ